MKILLANKFYYPRGGDCVAMMAQEALLKEQGHEVAVFAMDYPDNLPSEWDTYFVPEVSFATPGLAGKWKAACRLFGLGDIRTRFGRLLKEFRPDVVHLHNIHSYLSPGLTEMAKRSGARVIWTLHDYKLVCPAYLCSRDGCPCEECFDSRIRVFTHRCMKSSVVASALAYAEALCWSVRRLERSVDCFIAPSEFMRQTMIRGGFSPDKIATIPNFIDTSRLLPPARPEGYACYVGRLSPEKGVGEFLETAIRSPLRWKIVGDGPLLSTLQLRYDSPSVEFLGKQPRQAVYDLVSKAAFSVIPSVWYENNPMAVIESLCLGTPVLGSAMGGIPELIDEGVNGIVFDPSDSSSLPAKLSEITQLSLHCNRESIARESALRFSSARYYQQYRSLLASLRNSFLV